MKVNEVIDMCNSHDYWSFWEFEEDCDAEAVVRDLNLDRARWYEISTNVYKCEDGFVGVTGVSNLYSEMMSWSDCDCKCVAEEYKQVPTVTYVPINYNEPESKLEVI